MHHNGTVFALIGHAELVALFAAVFCVAVVDCDDGFVVIFYANYCAYGAYSAAVGALWG